MIFNHLAGTSPKMGVYCWMLALGAGKEQAETDLQWNCLEGRRPHYDFPSATRAKLQIWASYPDKQGSTERIPAATS